MACQRINFSQIDLYKISVSGDAFCLGCSHAFEGLDTISEEEPSSDEELTTGVGNMVVDAQKKNKATNTEGILTCMLFRRFICILRIIISHNVIRVGVCNEMIKLDEQLILGGTQQNKYSIFNSVG